jgi:putative FmdB family regulatory protein
VPELWRGVLDVRGLPERNPGECLGFLFRLELLRRLTMPLYEYRCGQCGKRFEVLQKVGASSAGVVCPACGGSEVAKQHSTFASSMGSGGGGSLPCGAPTGSGCGSGFS